jgi:uroporphyrinogen III methyltransferase/synthase
MGSDPFPKSGLLVGKTVMVTRAAAQASSFVQQLAEHGARVMEMPTLEIGAPSSWEALDRAIAQINQFHWLILTSTNGVDYFFERYRFQYGAIAPVSAKIAVVGEKTAQRLQQLGMTPQFIPPNFIADALVEHFPEPLTGCRVLFPRVESGGREVLVKELTQRGAIVTEVPAYESRCPATIAPEALTALQSGQVDVITFASSKTVQHCCQLLQQVDPMGLSWLDAVAIASIGPQTSKTCRELLQRVDIEAVEYTLTGLLAAILGWAASPDKPLS